jgi:hypothetical protein
MTKITISNEITKQLLNSLLQSRDGVEVCDASGFTIGVHTPSADLVLEPPPLSEEELNRRESEAGFTTEEVLAHLRGL